MQAQGHSVVHLYGKNVECIEVILPPLSEQQKIAEILEKWDELINEQKTLIDTLMLRKKGLVQKLLTGETRFKEFTSLWKHQLLSEVAWYQEGPGLRKWQFRESGVKVINITNIVDGKLDLSRTNRHITQEEFEKTYRHFLIDANDIVVASSGNSYCKHGIVREQDLPLIMNTSVIRFKPLDNCDYHYLNQFLKSPFLKQQIDKLITGGAQPNFGPAHLAEVVLPIPELEEQKTIGLFLNSLDQEVENEKQKLVGMEKQKQGLMQQLLTGKLRV